MKIKTLALALMAAGFRPSRVGMKPSGTMVIAADHIAVFDGNGRLRLRVRMGKL